MTQVNRILIDCTQTYKTGLNTGIQRVVRNIIKNAPDICEELNLKCIPVITNGNNFKMVSIPRNPKESIEVHDKCKSSLRYLYEGLRKGLQFIFPILKTKNFAFLIHIKLLLTDIVKGLLYIAFSPLSIFNYYRLRVIPKKGDLLLLPDASWAYPIWDIVKKAKKQGASVGLLIHDLIPIYWPDVTVPEHLTSFSKWLEQSILHVDFYIANSQATRNEISAYISKHYPEKNGDIKFDSFRLGSVIDMVEKKASVQKELKAIYENPDHINTYLIVGTIEPRKNHKYLLNTFDLLWKNNINVNLCIVGRAGWLCDETVWRVKLHKRFQKNLFMINDASDTDLEYCYRHAKALTFPSIAEGFGLPIVESLHNKLSVFATDIPVHREIGGEFCTYFDIQDPTSLYEIISEIEKTDQMPKVKDIEEFTWPTWKGSSREFLTKALTLAKSFN